MIAEIGHTDRPADEAVHTSLIAADRLRRRRDASRRVWQAAPIVAGISLILAAAARWAGWSSLLGIAALVVGFAAIAVYRAGQGRDHAVSDRVAAQIDADAGLGGELRSATWFAARDPQDPWIRFHVDNAAARLRALDWSTLYPAVRARRAQATTVVMVIAAVALGIVLPKRIASSTAAGVAVRTDRRAADLARLADLIPPELQKQLEDLLAAAENQSASPAQRAASAAELRALLAKLSQLKDRESLKELAKTLDPNGNGKTLATAPDMKTLAERAKKTSEMSALSQEMRKSLEKLSENLKEAAEAENAAPKDPREATAGAKNQRGDAAQTDSKADVDESSIQSVKDASAGGGAGMIMMSNEEAAMGGEAGLGVGGGSAPNNGGGQMAAIAQALKKETVDASTDNAGDNVLTEVRRKTEHGDATVGFTRATSGTFDRSRAAAPPAVPEARRQGVQTYFIRKQ